MSDPTDINQWPRHRPMTLEQIAEWYQVHPDTFRKWRKQGWIPCVEISERIVLYWLDAVDRAMEDYFGKS